MAKNKRIGVFYYMTGKIRSERTRERASAKIADGAKIDKTEGDRMLLLIEKGEDMPDVSELDDKSQKKMERAWGIANEIMDAHNAALEVEKQEKAAAEEQKSKTVNDINIATAVGFAKNQALLQSSVGSLGKAIGTRFVITETGLTMADNKKPITLAETAAAISTLASATEGADVYRQVCAWALGDLICLYEDAAGPEAAELIINQVIEITGKQKHTVMEARRLSKSFKPDQRIPGVTMTHHQELLNYRDSIKPAAFKKIVDGIFEADKREITTPSGEVIEQRRPISCRELRGKLQEASGKGPKGNGEKDTGKNDKQDAGSDQSTDKKEPAKDPTDYYLYINADGKVSWSYKRHDASLANHIVYYVKDNLVIGDSEYEAPEFDESILQTPRPVKKAKKSAPVETPPEEESAPPVSDEIPD